MNKFERLSQYDRAIEAIKAQCEGAMGGIPNGYSLDYRVSQDYNSNLRCEVWMRTVAPAGRIYILLLDVSYKVYEYHAGDDMTLKGHITVTFYDGAGKGHNRIFRGHKGGIPQDAVARVVIEHLRTEIPIRIKTQEMQWSAAEAVRNSIAAQNAKIEAELALLGEFVKFVELTDGTVLVHILHPMRVSAEKLPALKKKLIDIARLVSEE